jgi:hypothetical protein
MPKPDRTSPDPTAPDRVRNPLRVNSIENLLVLMSIMIYVNCGISTFFPPDCQEKKDEEI